MVVQQCFLDICFMPLNGGGQKFFGFSEFLAGLALMVLAWTIGDVRYRFRVRVAPIPLQGITYSVVVAVGVLTLLTDLWRAEQWLVPKGNLLTPASWQAILGGLFLLTFLTWSWFAFIRPPTFGRLNAERFAQALYRLILKGSSEELSIIADELAHSARAFVRHATDMDRPKNYWPELEDKKRDTPKVEQYANDLLLLIGDKRLCRIIVESSPGTALALFQAIAETGKFGVQIGIFAKNLVNEALANKDSFLYREVQGYESGLIGFHKPLSHAIFANYKMVETIGSLLDHDIYGKTKWDFEQWDAYCRIVLMTIHGWVEQGNGYRSLVLHQAMDCILNASSDLYTLNQLPNPLDSDSVRRLYVVIDFVQQAVKILDKVSVPEHVRVRIKEGDGHVSGDNIYDQIANLIFETIFHASKVKSPQWECWNIQYGAVWSKLFISHQLNGSAGKVVRFKVRRLLYSEISSMRRFPNFKGSRILGFCLNVMGLTIRKRGGESSIALQRSIIAWTKKYCAWLHEHYTPVAEACLVEGMTYDSEKLRLIRTPAPGGLRRDLRSTYLDLDPLATEPNMPSNAAPQIESKA